MSPIVCTSSVLEHPNLTLVHHDGPLAFNCNNLQYKIVKYNGITLKAGSLADRYCSLTCGAIVSYNKKYSILCGEKYFCDNRP